MTSTGNVDSTTSILNDIVELGTRVKCQTILLTIQCGQYKIVQLNSVFMNLELVIFFCLVQAETCGKANSILPEHKTQRVLSNHRILLNQPRYRRSRYRRKIKSIGAHGNKIRNI